MDFPRPDRYHSPDLNKMVSEILMKNHELHQSNMRPGITDSP